MAGFLDSKERVVDMVLTGIGKDLLMKGDLRFIYWIPYDDEVDYDPYISGSDSLSPDDLATARSRMTEEPLVREASSGYRELNLALDDQTNVGRPMFTIPAGRSNLPTMLSSITGTVSVTMKQQKVERVFSYRDGLGADVVKRVGPIDWGVSRFSPSESVIELDYTPGSYPNDFDTEGFLVTVYASGTIQGAVHKLANEWLDSGGKHIGGTVHGAFTLTKPTLVRWGADDSFGSVVLPAGFYTASNDTFGFDPIPGTVKTAYAVDTGSLPGRFTEVLNNRDSSGSIVYMNDLKLEIR